MRGASTKEPTSLRRPPVSRGWHGAKSKGVSTVNHIGLCGGLLGRASHIQITIPPPSAAAISFALRGSKTARAHTLQRHYLSSGARMKQHFHTSLGSNLHTVPLPRDAKPRKPPAPPAAAPAPGSAAGGSHGL